jgi:Fe-S-cluster containining protein
MTAKTRRVAKRPSTPKRGFSRRCGPVVPAKARRIEREIVAILKRLLAEAYPSCLDKRFAAAYGEALRLFADYQREVLAAYPHRVTCGASCGVCCNHWPEDAYSFEVQLIADALRRTRPRDLGIIRAALAGDIACLDGIRRAVDKTFGSPVQREALGDIDPYDVVLSAFYQFQRPCPLLDKKGSCAIYRIRPITCRVYVSFSPPELCNPDTILGDEARTYLLDLERDSSELFDKLHFMYDVFDGNTGFRSMLHRALE